MKYCPDLRCKKCGFVCPEFDIDADHEPGYTGRYADDKLVYKCTRCGAKNDTLEKGWIVVTKT